MSSLKRVELFLDWTVGRVRAFNRAGETLAIADSISALKGQVSGDCAVILGRRSSYMKSTRLPNAKASEIESIVRIQAAQLFPSAVGELAFGFLLKSDVNAEGRQAVLAAAPITLLNELYAEANSAGLKICGVVPVAIGSMYVAHELGVSTCGLVEQVSDGMAIDIVENGQLVYSRVPPIESDIATEIERTFAAAGVSPSPIVSMPGSPIASAAFVSHRGAADSLAKHIDELDTLSLEPPVVAIKRANTIVNNRARLAALMALAAIGVGAVVWDDRDRAAQYAAKNKAEYNQKIQKSTKARDAQKAKSGKVNAVAAEVRRAFEPGQSPGEVLAVIGNQTPQGVWLTGVTFERGKNLMLRGTATSNEAVGNYLDTLNLNPRFRDLKLVFANQALIEATNVVQFSMTAHVVGNLPTTKSKKERSRK